MPASEKVSSLFELHTDIVEKSGRKVRYGHKLNMTCGRSGMVSDLVIEEGNPADSVKRSPMIERNVGTWPRRVRCTGG